MPAMASIVVLKADGVTNITYDAIAASPGDAGAAEWRQDTGAAAGLPVGLRARFSMWSKWNGPRTARQVKLVFSLPYAVQNSTTTLYSATDTFRGETFMTLPQAIPAATLNEGVAQFLGLGNSTLIKTSTQSGYSPT